MPPAAAPEPAPASCPTSGAGDERADGCPATRCACSTSAALRVRLGCDPRRAGSPAASSSASSATRSTSRAARERLPVAHGPRRRRRDAARPRRPSRTRSLMLDVLEHVGRPGGRDRRGSPRAPPRRRPGGQRAASRTAARLDALNLYRRLAPPPAAVAAAGARDASRRTACTATSPWRADALLGAGVRRRPCRSARGSGCRARRPPGLLVVSVPRSARSASRARSPART